MIPIFKQNKWYNFGDVSHRTEGGCFVKRNGDELEIVQTHNNENHGGKGYTINLRTEYVSELIDRYKDFKNNPKTHSIGKGCDWARYVVLEKEKNWNMDTIVMYLAADMIGWCGGDCEAETGTNYWEMLAAEGITRNSV